MNSIPALSRVAFGQVSVKSTQANTMMPTFEIEVSNDAEQKDFDTFKSLLNPKTIKPKKKTGSLTLEQYPFWANNKFTLNGVETNDLKTAQQLANLAIRSGNVGFQQVMLGRAVSLLSDPNAMGAQGLLDVLATKLGQVQQHQTK